MKQRLPEKCNCDSRFHRLLHKKYIYYSPLFFISGL
jgi:hypothetical protein